MKTNVRRGRTEYPGGEKRSSGSLSEGSVRFHAKSVTIIFVYKQKQKVIESINFQEKYIKTKTIK